MSTKDNEFSDAGWVYLFTTSSIVLCFASSLYNSSPIFSTVYAKPMLISAFAIPCISVLADPFLDIRSHFSYDFVGNYEKTRSAGLYLQTNVAGAALPLIFAAIAPRIGRRSATICACAMAIACLLTFSRASIFLMIFVILASLLFNYIYRITVFIMLFFIAISYNGEFMKEVLVRYFNIDQGSGFNRLFGVENNYFDVSSYFSDVRYSLVEYAYADFAQRPWLGNGLGYSWRWAVMQSENVGTHNLYLRYMLEYGILGALIWPAFLYSAYRCRNQYLNRSWAFCICACGFITAFFSHNIPEQGMILVPILAALTLPMPQVGGKCLVKN
jgi:O-antigen ligase